MQSGTSEGGSSQKGIQKSRLPTAFGKPQFPDLRNDEENTTLIETPVTSGSVPKSYPDILNRRDFWDLDHVKLPCSDQNVTLDKRKGWDLVKAALTGSQIASAEQLEAAIKSYNGDIGSKWKFTTLKLFFKEILSAAESKAFFDSQLPKIIELALRLPELITGGIPLLKRDRTHSISLSQLQVACLLANAFLCTYPGRNGGKKKNVEYRDYPTINMDELFQCERNGKAVLQKIRCLLHYFKRVTDSVPTGVLTFSRNYIAPNLSPKWFASERTLSRLYVSSEGKIEDEGYGFFQMDFADKFIGGLINTTGCVQEEIRFCICPELIISRLFTECIGPGEAVIITGCERFSNYSGYGSSFKWTGNYEDSTPSDQYGRRYCTVLALDAMNYRWKPAKQYMSESILRELNKAYAGFSWGSSLADKTELCAVATGNWGCGIFRGNVQLKYLLQHMAASEAGRDLAYFTFNDVKLQNMAETHRFLVENGVTIGNLYKFILEFCDDELFKSTNVFDFLKSRIVTKNAGTASGL